MRTGSSNGLITRKWLRLIMLTLKGMDQPKAKRPPRDPRKIHLKFTSVLEAVPSPSMDGPTDGVTFWHVDAYCGRGRFSKVGTLTFAVLDLDELVDPTLDFDGGLQEMAGAVLDLGTGEVLDEIKDSDNEPIWDRKILLCDQAKLAPEWRGFGIGPLLAGLAIDRLSSGCSMALCVPEYIPDSNKEHYEWTAEKKWAIRAKIQQAWESIGFEELKSDVYVLWIGSERSRQMLEEVKAAVLGEPEL
jgi:hypothetical protein